MNLVTMINGAAVTSTLAIANGTETQHKNVMELVRNYQPDLEEFGGVAFETRPFETAGGIQKREVAILNEQQATLLLTYMRNSDIVRQFKKALVKAFWELAQKAASPALPDFQDPVAAARAWADQLEGRQFAEQKSLMLENQLAEQAPKVAAQDMLAVSKGDLCIRDAAKALNIQEKRFKALLIQQEWVYRRMSNGRLVGNSVRERQGVMTHKPVTIYHNNGDTETVLQPLITPKGLAKLAEMIAMGVSA
ncbi:Antirepressor protein C-terminal domain-containing protein [Chromobacterium violaceum]|uniref:Rha family transcriptional regulator n=1 Tax=Chromobacterium violaceum TaxID=536 RepID=UPI003CE8A937